MYTSKMMIVMRRDLKMRKGKIAAQAGHACVRAILKALQRDGLLSCIHIEENGAITLPEDLPETPLTAWFTRGEAKICVYVDSEEELLALDREAKERGILSALICRHDGVPRRADLHLPCAGAAPRRARRRADRKPAVVLIRPFPILRRQRKTTHLPTFPKSAWFLFSLLFLPIAPLSTYGLLALQKYSF